MTHLDQILSAGALLALVVWSVIAKGLDRTIVCATLALAIILYSQRRP